MNQRNRILKLLKQNSVGVNNFEFFTMSPPILRPAARIEELRKMGWPIETERVRQGVFRYKLEKKTQQLGLYER